MFCSLQQHLISDVCIIFSSFAVNDSQPHWNIGIIRERISFTFNLRTVLIFLHIGPILVRAAVACATIERTSGFEHSSETIVPRYLKLCVSLKLLSFWVSFALFISFLSFLN